MEELRNFLLPNESTGIVACSATEARLWRSTSRFGPWTLIKSMEHPAAAARERELTADRQGRAFDSFGAGRHAMSPGQSAQEHEIRRFAKQVAEVINDRIASGEVSHLVLIAAPRFLGCLRPELSDLAGRAVRLAAAKNVTNLDADAVKKYFE